MVEANLEEEALAAEAAARDAFAAFYSGLTDGEDQNALPPNVTLALARWVEARKRWELAQTETKVPSVTRLGLKPPASVMLPASLPARDALAALFAPQLWQTEASGLAMIAKVSDTAQVRVEFDEVLGFGPEQAIRQIARSGPAAAQTFLALASLWMERLAGQPHETYLTLAASDLLRFQGKKATPKGGYHRDDILAKGRDLYLLSRITVPHALGSESMALGRLLSLEAMEAGQSDEGQSIVRFRYHLGLEAHGWMQESVAQVAPRLLSYHPVRQKYQILLGFCLAWHRGNHPEETELSLPHLLELAAIPMPEKRLSEFLTSLEDALSELASDGILPGVKLLKPQGWHELLASRQTRLLLQKSRVQIEKPRPELADRGKH
ncbi:hypothetical protein [Armatimonas sp.]|uniref:hypothetical protein n=1 Tax=Armatimonas sp. TaxID=1872638 RepID=UPI00286A19E5|nr:hypothetical protein [Armatimonas sp.]